MSIHVICQKAQDRLHELTSKHWNVTVHDSDNDYHEISVFCDNSSYPSLKYISCQDIRESINHALEKVINDLQNEKG